MPSKANNDTKVPRCPVCQQYMEKVRETASGKTYECCGVTKSRPNPEDWAPRKEDLR